MKYFIVYEVRTTSIVGTVKSIFSKEIERDQPITSIEDIKDIEREMLNPKRPDTFYTVISWQRFESVHGEQ